MTLEPLDPAYEAFRDASHPIVLFADARWLSQPGQGVATFLEELYGRIEAADLPGLRCIYGVTKGNRPGFLGARGSVFEYPSDRFFWRTFQMGRELGRLGVDVVHFQYTLPLDLPARITSVLTTHDLLFLDHPDLFPWTYRAIRRPFFLSSLRRASSVMTISDGSAASILRHSGIPRDRLHMVPLGFGSRLKGLLATSPAKAPAGRYLLTVGRHEQRKNYGRLIEAFADSGLHDRDGFTLLIVGKPTAGFMPEAHGAPGVQFLFECSSEELAWLYQHSSGFVFPSIAEGFGLPVVEAMEFGVPTIVSRTYPVKSVLAGCVSTFDPFSTREIREALLALVAHRSASTTLPSGAPSWDDHARRFLQIIASHASRS